MTRKEKRRRLLEAARLVDEAQWVACAAINYKLGGEARADFASLFRPEEFSVAPILFNWWPAGFSRKSQFERSLAILFFREMQ